MGNDFGCKVKTLSLYYNIFYLFFCECRLNLLILHRANVQESALDNMVAKITRWSFLSHEMELPVLCRMETEGYSPLRIKLVILQIT